VAPTHKTGQCLDADQVQGLLALADTPPTPPPWAQD
jgi:hypothetical protein